MKSLEAKVNFSFYISWIVLGSVISLFCLFTSVMFSKPLFLFLAIIFFGAGILIPILIYRGEKQPEFKQTPYTKGLAKRFFDREKKPTSKLYPMDSKKGGELIKEMREEIPAIEIVEEDDGKEN